MRLYPLLCFLIFILSFDVLVSKEEIKRIDNLIYIKNPAEPPKNLVQGFVPEGSTLLISTEMKKFGFENIETAIVFENIQKPNELLLYYELLLKSLDWKILQMEKKEKKSFILAEMRMRELITIVTESIDEKTLVKIFLKKQSSY